MDELAIAWEHYRSGRFAEADEIGRGIVASDAENSAAWHLLGLVRYRRERPGEAEACYRRALATRPEFAEAHGDLGVLLATQGRLEEAVAALRRSLDLGPGSADTHHNLGLALFQSGRGEESAASLRRALAIDPDHPMAAATLGQVLSMQGKYAELAEVFGPLARDRPTDLAARLRLGEALINLGDLAKAEACFEAAARLAPASAEAHLGLGLVATALGRWESAIVPWKKAAELAPDRAEPRALLGKVFRTLGRLDEALDWVERAARLQPEDARIHRDRGFLLDELRRREDAVSSFDHAIRLAPDDAEAHHNRGVALGKLARYDEAIAAFDRAISLEPNYPEARRNRAMARLTLGELERGWAEFEWRWKCRDLTMPTHPRPLWQGEPLEGRTILLHVEQGLGDTLQFIRYAPLVQARGGRVVVECQKALVSLVQNSPGIHQVLARGEPLPPFDVHSPLLRLMGLFSTTLESIPATVPYLRADPARIAVWHERLSAWPGFKVGIAWQGNPKHTRDRDRSFPLARFGRLAEIDDVRLISLQKGYGVEQLRDPHRHFPFPVIDLGEEVDPGLERMEDTPALMMGLDLIVTPDTSLAHLAGALGLPVWIALPKAPDWRWLTGREDSPWYPTARLFRQSHQDCWEPVFDRMATALEETLASTDRREG